MGVNKYSITMSTLQRRCASVTTSFSNIEKKDEFQFSQTNFRKIFLGELGDPPKPKNRGQFFFSFFKVQKLKIILRRKPGYLGVKWTYGEFTKSKYTKSEIRVVPP